MGVNITVLGEKDDHGIGVKVGGLALKEWYINHQYRFLFCEISLRQLSFISTSELFP